MIAPGHAASPLRLEHVGVEFGGRRVLDDVSLTLRAGEVTALIGASGAGKSTLIAVCNGLVRPREGRVSGAGGPIESAAALRAHRRGLATVFQDLALVEQRSALDNVLIGLAERRGLAVSLVPWPRAEMSRALAIMAELGLAHLALTRVDRLSGGERRRVGIARALIRQPALLLADEPLNSLDPTLAGLVVRLLAAEAARRGAAVLVCLHQIDFLPALADRVVALERGRVVLDAPIGQTRRQDFAALFSAHPAYRRRFPALHPKGTDHVQGLALAHADPP